MLRPGAPGRVEAVRELIEPVSPGSVDGRCRDALAGGEDDLAGAEQLTGAEHRLARRDTLGEHPLVSAPAEVDAVHAAALESEAGPPRGQQQGGIRARTTAPALAQVGAEGQVAPLRRPFAQVPARRVEQLGGIPRQRQQRVEGGDGVGGRPRVARLDGGAEEAGVVERDAHACGESRLVVGEVERQAVVVHRGRREGEQGARRDAVAVALEGGSAEPAAGVGRQDAEARGDVESARDALRGGGIGQRSQRARRQGAEVLAPVDDHGVRCRLEVDDHAGAAAAEVGHPRHRAARGRDGGKDISVEHRHGLVLTRN